MLLYIYCYLYDYGAMIVLVIRGFATMSVSSYKLVIMAFLCYVSVDIYVYIVRVRALDIDHR